MLTQCSQVIPASTVEGEITGEKTVRKIQLHVINVVKEVNGKSFVIRSRLIRETMTVETTENLMYEMPSQRVKVMKVKRINEELSQQVFFAEIGTQDQRSF